MHAIKVIDLHKIVNNILKIYLHVIKLRRLLDYLVKVTGINVYNRIADYSQIHFERYRCKIR